MSAMLRKVIVLVVLIGLPLGMIYPLWGCPVTAGEDDLVYYWPIRKLVAQQMRSGQVPEANPAVGAGWSGTATGRFVGAAKAA